MLAELCGTIDIGAFGISRIGIPNRGRPTAGTGRGKTERFGAFRSLFFIYRQNLRYDLSRLPYQNRITNSHIQLIDAILVMERRSLYIGSAEANRFKDSGGSNSAGTSDTKPYFLYNTFFFLRWVFICDGPAWNLGGCSKVLSHLQTVHLNHCSVNIIGQVTAGFANLLDCFPYLIGRPAEPVSFDHLNSLFFQPFQAFRMSLEFYSSGLLNIEYKKGQLSLPYNLRIQLAQSPGGAIAGIGKYLLAGRLQPFIDLFKICQPHMDFPTDLDIGHRFLQAANHIPDHFYVFRHVFSLIDSVAAGHSHGQTSFGIPKSHGQSVNFLLYHKDGIAALLLYLLNKAIDLLLLEHILKAQHRDIVLHKDASLPFCNPANLLGR